MSLDGAFLRPGKALVVVTDGIGDPTGQGTRGVGQFLAAHWLPPSDLFAFAAHAVFYGRGRPGLLARVDFRTRLSADLRDKLDQRAIWPLVVATAPDGAAAGIVIREIPGEFFRGSRVREFQHLLNADDDARRAGFPVVDTPARLLLARFAEAMKLLHRLGIIFARRRSESAPDDG